MGSLVALILVPWPLVFLTVPEVSTIYAAIPDSVLIIVTLCGAAWGIGGIFWGRAIDALGLALGVSLMMGLINVFGSIGPMYIFEPGQLNTPGGHMLMISLTVLIVGVVVIAIAGKAKESDLKNNSEHSSSPKSTIRLQTPFILGLVFCIFSGVLSAGVNFGLVYGAPISEKAIELGVPLYATGFAIWSLVFTSNYFVNLLYGVITMIKNRNVKRLITDGSPGNWLGALFMGLAWPGGIIIYGIGAAGMGPYGAYVGFPMMILVSILTSNIAGALSGEWKGTSARPRWIMIAGVVVIFAAFILLGNSHQLLSK